MDSVSIAFVPLNDAAPLIVAREKGFAAEQGLELELIRETSWSRVAAMIATGRVDAAHMLAPLAMAIMLGKAGARQNLAAPILLNANGNSLVVSPALAAGLIRDPAARLADPLATADDLGRAIRESKAPVTLGIVHEFSCHALLMRYFLAAGGIDPDRDVSLIEVDPSQTTSAMETGEIDGFLAGEPWGTAAILAGLAELAAPTASMWHRGVEKLLAVRTDWLDRDCDRTDRLVRAIDHAAAWCDDSANHKELAHILERPDHVGQPAEFLITALSGRLVPRRGADPVSIGDYVLFHRDGISAPLPRHANWIYAQMVRWNMVADSPESHEVAKGLFRPDIYMRATGYRDSPDLCAADGLFDQMSGA
ncbi:CmpA/NrtA family ABC transporter substrate-binding protein [Sphingosinithalassobacter portus]|uniref:CmpA/NrtA family ABC transporter substrate-binding protein n=1 Tax=Stakelama portus TaxID=2676234 RepID=UPI000D6E8177|nr:CmpA/NrtA family ABC transporter substrate-binding protein [Sphingosinithalassobacter portus]